LRAIHYVFLSTGDVAEPSTSERACATALDKFGKINGLILNAGTLDPLGTYLISAANPATISDASF
jgi:NAD(P)-dependent dehydrogenase (short-subunit alcohol dehydrogenase family)